MSLAIHPITIKEANQLVKRWHRHHKPVVGALFAIAVARDNEEEPCGAVIVGRPVARMSQDGYTAEIVRCVTDGTTNACSMLNAAAWRTARGMGYRRLITYTLPSEGGASLKASGFHLVGEAGGGSWSRKNRPRVDEHPTERKLKWIAQ